MAGKDWRGRHVGLWRFYDAFLRDAIGKGRQGGGGAAEVGACTGSLMWVAMGLCVGEGAGGGEGFDLGDDSEAPMMYTNIELVDVRRFRREDMWEFVTAVDESHGIYLYNWGDAQIRWLQVAAYCFFFSLFVCYFLLFTDPLAAGGNVLGKCASAQIMSFHYRFRIYLNPQSCKLEQVATYLEDAQVHRYCHFGYQHAAAFSAPFDCWQQPWVGYDCGDPLGTHS